MDRLHGGLIALWLPTDIETAGSQAKLHQEPVRRRYGVALTHFSFANAFGNLVRVTSQLSSRSLSPETAFAGRILPDQEEFFTFSSHSETQALQIL